MVQKNQFLTGEQVIAGLERVQVYTDATTSIG
jgi:hypothetical protein